MSQFLYPSYILSEDRETLMRELTNDRYKSFIKTIAIQEPVVLETFVDNLLKELIYDSEISVSALTNVDKLYMLLCVRSYCISPQIVFSTKIKEDKKEKKNKEDKEITKAEISVDLNEVLNRLGNYPIKHKYSFTEGGIDISGTLPKRFYYDHIIDVAADSLSTIKTKDNTVNLYDLNTHERRQILNSLPSAILPKIIEFLQHQEDIIKDDPIINFNTDIELPFGNKLDLQLFNGTVGELVKMLFNTDLKELYTTEYTLMRRFKFTFDAIQTCTPAELSVYYEIIRKDLEREKQEMQQDKGGGGSASTGPPKNLAPS